MKVPFFDLKRQYLNLQDELERAVIEVMRSTQYIEGGAVREFEAELAHFIGVKHAISCGNGTDALRIALQAAGVSPGSEVVTTPFSFFATAEAIAELGATPVFADIQPDTLNLDPESVRSKLTRRTKAIVPVHIFGLPADMEEILSIASESGLIVIEDACQAIGAEYHNKKTGAIGHMGCFSFYPTKNVGAFGDGGMITTDDDDLANVCRATKAHAAGKAGAQALHFLNRSTVSAPDAEGATDLYDPYKYYNYFIGWNSRLDSIQAAVLNTKLRYLNQFNMRRRQIASQYTEAFQNLPVKVAGAMKTDRVSCFHQYAILCGEKEELSKYLAEKGVGTGNFYPVPLHRQEAFSSLGYRENDLPAAEQACRESVCLPIFPELTDDEIAYVINVVRSFFNKFY